jgi:hypothetical protein
MIEKVAFLMKDFVLLAVSFYLLKRDLSKRRTPCNPFKLITSLPITT